jgi:phage regulator Rha-like protein
MSEIIGYREVEEKVLAIRGQNVLLDRDVAALYSVETREINQAVKNNQSKFPEGYVIALDHTEKSELIKSFDRFGALKHSAVPPTAFTEKGLYMLATILKSPRATQTTIAIVETFAKMRELARAISQLSETQEEGQQKALMQKSGEILAEVLDDDALEVSGDETTIEINFAIMKIKHTVKRRKKPSA